MAKGTMIIDGQRVSFDGEKNVLSVIRKAGIEMPTFCYYSDLSVYGACRMCVVEDERGKIDSSCSMQPRDGMVIKTNSKRLLKHRRMILELLLASHNCNCTICGKSGQCHLQSLAQQFGVRRIRFDDTREHYETDSSSPAIVRDPNKCILCGDCVRVCEEMQGMNIIDFAYRGSQLQVMPAFDRKLSETKCVSCGQCAAVCQTGAITIKNEIGDAWRAIHDPKKRVVVQIAPAVRVAVGEAFGIPAGQNVLDKLVTALKLMGVDEVYDTTFSADMTTIEESSEFLRRLEKGGPFPMFTSCCPAWVKFLENENPKYLNNISTCKSPMEMFAAVIREKYAEKDAESGLETFNIAIMPCTAKKMEAARDEFKRNGRPDVDLVLTTQEVVDMIRRRAFSSISWSWNLPTFRSDSAPARQSFTVRRAALPKRSCATACRIRARTRFARSSSSGFAAMRRSRKQRSMSAKRSSSSRSSTVLSTQGSSLRRSTRAGSSIT